MKKVIVVLIATISCVSAWSQAGWNWGENKVENQGDYQYMSNLVKAEKYQEAAPLFQRLYNKVPDLNEALYIRGIEIYENLERQATDKTKKMQYQDTVLLAYNTRIEKYDGEAELLNRKGLVAYLYLRKRKGTEDKLFDLYQKIVDLNGSETYAGNFTMYMYATCDMKNASKIEEAEVLEIYDTIATLLSKKMEETTDEAYKTSIERNAEQVDKILSRCVEIDCEKINQLYGKRFEESPNLKLAKQIRQLMVQQECVKEPLFLETSVYVIEQEPSMGGYITIGNIYKSNQDYTEAIEAYKKAVELADSEDKKAELYLDIAGLYSRKGQKSTSRSYAYNALEVKPGYSAAYSLIGDLYFNSYEECKDENPLTSRAVFLAAYEMYKKAGNSSKMANAKQYFPSMTEIFERNKNVGDKINTGCWMNEEVELQKRP